MKNVIKVSALLLVACLLLSSCTNYRQKANIMNEWNPTEVISISNENPSGIIKKFDKNNAENQLEKSVLLSHLHELTGDIALAKVKVLGEANGKTYTFNVYASYSKENGRVECKEMKQELAAFTYYEQEDYELQNYNTPEEMLGAEEFLPENLRQDSTEIFDKYVYDIGKVTSELQTEAEEYFTMMK